MFLEVLLVVCGLFAYYYWSFRTRTSYWKEKGVPHTENTSFPLGSAAILHPDVLQNKISGHDAVSKQYMEFEGHRFYGVYSAMKANPILVLRDLDLVQHVMGECDQKTHY